MGRAETNISFPEFDRLDIGGKIKIRGSALTPKIPDDGTPSFNPGPLEVYRSVHGLLIIHNGNHLYYETRRRAGPDSDPLFECMKVKQTSDLDEILLDVIKRH